MPFDSSIRSRLKEVLLKSINNLFDNGVYTPEIELIVVLKPSQLQVERRKMIPYIRNSEDPDLYSTSDKMPSAGSGLSDTGVERRPSARKKTVARKSASKKIGPLPR
jgi:hypothetical protein